MSAFAAPAFGWLLQKLEAGGTLTVDVFAKGGSVGVAAIIIAVILTFFIKETGSAVKNSIGGSSTALTAARVVHANRSIWVDQIQTRFQMERDTLHRLLRDMLLSRAFEERAAEEYSKGNTLASSTFIRARRRSGRVLSTRPTVRLHRQHLS